MSQDCSVVVVVVAVEAAAVVAAMEMVEAVGTRAKECVLIFSVDPVVVEVTVGTHTRSHPQQQRAVVAVVVVVVAAEVKVEVLVTLSFEVNASVVVPVDFHIKEEEIHLGVEEEVVRTHRHPAHHQQIRRQRQRWKERARRLPVRRRNELY